MAAITSSSVSSLTQWLAPRELVRQEILASPPPFQISTRIKNLASACIPSFYKKKSLLEQSCRFPFIPDDAFILILKHLDPQSVIYALRVNHVWNYVITNNFSLPKLRLQTELPSRLLELLGGIDTILQLPIYEFRSRELRYFETAETKKCFIRWISPAAMTAPVMRFVDPCGRIGFLFLFYNHARQHQFVFALHEMTPCFSKNGNGKWGLTGHGRDAKILGAQFDNLFEDRNSDFCAFFSRLSLNPETPSEVAASQIGSS